jgi:VWFA-related protein
VRGLDQKAFDLNEDGRGAFAPDKVEVVANQKAAVSVMLVVDLSGSMRGRPVQAAKEAFAKFLEALLNEANDPDRAAFIGFTQKVTVTADTITDEKREVDFTNDMGKLLNVINFVDVDTGTGGTPLYDALFRAVKITSRQPGRRAIVLMTDGKDQGSTLTDSDPISEANRQHIPVFTIGLSTGRLDAQYLQRVAVRTGGQFQSAPTPEQLTQLLQNVLAQLKEQYVLTYTSRIPQVDGQSHTLIVQVNSPRGSSSSKLVFTLGQPVAPTLTAVAAPAVTPMATPQPSPAPSDTPAPPAASTAPIQSLMQNPALIVAIVAAALLLLLILVVMIALIMRRRSEAAAYAPPSTTGVTFPGVPPVARGTGSPTLMPPAGPPASAAPGRSTPTSAGTQLASPDLPKAPSPFEARPGPSQPSTQPASSAPMRIPPAPFQPAAGPGMPPPVAPLSSGGTVIIQRGPKLKTTGMLLNKKDPSWRFNIDRPSVTIGRAPGNTVVVEHPTISRQHASIKIEGDEFRLYDLGSSNGTFVNEQRVRDPVTLQDGVTVRFGEAEFIFKRVTL